MMRGVSDTAPDRGETAHRGEVLDVLHELLTEGRSDEVVSLVGQLVANNSALAVRAAKAESQSAELEKRKDELEKQLERLLGRYKKNEGTPKNPNWCCSSMRCRAARPATCSKTRTICAARPTSSSGRRQRSTIRKSRRPSSPRTQPVRKPAPPDLPRTENPLLVPASERACPVCGKERTCIGHDITEVIELEPAKVIVRQDKREKLACGDCEGELVRAPKGDKIVDGGKFGDTLEADILVGKYADGLPLHRARERYRRLGLDIPISTLVDQVRWSH